MLPKIGIPGQLTFRPLTPAEWPDFVQLFEEHGPQNGCWCMYWRIRRTDCQHQFGQGNKLAFKQLLDSGNVPGILAYHQEQPVGWCSVAPRQEFAVLDRSPTLKRFDDQPVWSITCFFISRPFRRRGLTELLIQAAVRYAAGRGARIIEAYPLRTEITKLLPYERFMGIESTFTRLGFHVVARRSDRRPLMRLDIRNGI